MLGGVLDDHPLAALEPAADDPVTALQGVGADLHVFHHALWVDHLDHGGLGGTDQRVARDGDRLRVHRALQAHLHVAAGQQFAMRIAEQGTHGDGVGAGVDRQVGEQQLAGQRVLAAVGQDQAHGDVLVGDTLHLAFADRPLHGGDFAGRLGEVHVDRIDLLDAGQRCRRVLADQRAFGDQRTPRAAVDRRGDRGVAQAQAGLLQFGLGRGDLRQGLARVGLRFGVLAFADGAVLDQVGVALELVGRRRVAGLGPGQGAAADVQGRLQGRRVDLEQHGAGADVLAFLVQATGDDAGDARPHFSLAVRFQASGQLAGDADRRRPGDDHADLGGGLRSLPGVRCFFAAQQE
ncbi:hypothetical protein PAERUG_E7_London_9_VIM_2_02_13_02588 [Pseudomonas aeruginosa]|nr:hypothetical protein PAERUG_E7_London_9_VIM_2_02_13_02588 [Pseudomonas aeruginosa]